MDFHFDGLQEPLALPDEWLTTRQFENMQRFLAANEGEPEDFRFIRECIAALLGDPEFVARTDDLPMNPRNVAQWEAVNNHLAELMMGSTKTGDDITDEVVNAPLEERAPKGEAPSESTDEKR